MISNTKDRTFALLNEPMDYQLTVHYNNYGPAMRASGFQDVTFISDYYLVRSSLNNQTIQKTRATMYNLINHYGQDKIERFITECIGVAV